MQLLQICVKVALHNVYSFAVRVMVNPKYLAHTVQDKALVFIEHVICHYLQVIAYNSTHTLFRFLLLFFFFLPASLG